MVTLHTELNHALTLTVVIKLKRIIYFETTFYIYSTFEHSNATLISQSGCSNPTGQIAPEIAIASSYSSKSISMIFKTSRFGSPHGYVRDFTVDYKVSSP